MPKSHALNRVSNPLVLRALIEGNAPDELVGDESQEEWLADPLNVALRVKDDLGLAQFFEPGVYEIHVFFRSRGRTALKRARAMLAEMFNTYGAKALYAETPVFIPDTMSGKRTLLFARLLGFKPVRETERPIGRVIFSVLSRPSFRALSAAE